MPWVRNEQASYLRSTPSPSSRHRTVRVISHLDVKKGMEEMFGLKIWVETDIEYISLYFDFSDHSLQSRAGVLESEWDVSCLSPTMKVGGTLPFMGKEPLQASVGSLGEHSPLRSNIWGPGGRGNGWRYSIDPRLAPSILCFFLAARSVSSLPH